MQLRLFKIRLGSSQVEWLIFSVLFAVVIIRAFAVFYVHDELVSKYSYMLDWNPLPYMGYKDANNQFLNSLLGGFFIRLFQSDHIVVTRLGSVLSFPIFFWGLVKFKKYFKSKEAFFFFLLSISSCIYVLDFFSLARGYGLAWAFTIMGIFYTSEYAQRRESRGLLLALTSWLLAIYANLSVLGLMTIGYGIILLCCLYFKKWRNAIVAILFLFPILYLVEYSFDLQFSGKLYAGSISGFSTTIRSLQKGAFGVQHSLITAFIAAVFLTAFSSLFFSLKAKRFSFSNHLFGLLLVLSILSILTLNFFFKVNFPEGRVAAYLILLFYGSLAFLLDRFLLKKVSIALIAVVVILFSYQLNFTHTRDYFYEHFDEALLSKIPTEVQGIPASTGGRFWQIDNELSKVKEYPTREFQLADKVSDTLQDFIIHLNKMRPKIKNTYELIHQDDISGLALFSRKKKLQRTQIQSLKSELKGDGLYFDLARIAVSQPLFIRCRGKMNQMSIYDQKSILFSLRDTVLNSDLSIDGLSPAASAPLNEDNSISFDFTHTLYFSENSKLTVYILNTERTKLDGEITIEVYQIEQP